MTAFPLLSDDQIEVITKEIPLLALMARWKIARAIESESRAPLLAEIERLTREVERLKADASPEMLKLVCDLRFALGDNGQRMQPELVEYAASLKADAERYQFLRNWTRGLPAGKGAVFALPVVHPAIGANIMRGSVAQHLDKAIDAARAQGGE